MLLAALQSLAGAHRVNPDGMSYLELAQRVAEGRARDAVSGFWSPLFPWVLGAVERIVRPSLAAEVALAHAVNFGIFLVDALCFELLRRELAALQRSSIMDGAMPALPLDGALGVAVAYALFAWSAIWAINLMYLTPDTGVAAVVFAASALLVRMRRRPTATGTSVLLGAVLGLGYLTKTVLLPASAFFLIGAFVAQVDAAGERPTGEARRSALRAALRRCGVAGLALCCVGAPLVLALSAQKQRPTFGDVGKLAYGWYVDDYPFPFWRGEEPGSGLPKHAVARLGGQPAVYAFPGAPRDVTYPLWFDPSYWNDGMRVRVRPLRQAAAVVRHVELYAEWFGVPFVLALLLNFQGAGRRRGAVSLRKIAFLLVPSIGVLGIYALVHAESRFVGPSAAALCLGLLAVAPAAVARAASRRIAHGVAVATILTIAMQVAPPLALEARQLAGDALGVDEPPSDAWTTAEQLRAAGVAPETPVGSIGFTYGAYWARLARLRIVAESPSIGPTPPCCQNDAEWADVTRRLAEAGARVVVADPGLRPPSSAGWQPLGETGYHLLRLAPPR